MKPVSPGVGLCVLGVCIFGAAAISTLRLGGIATAAGGSTAIPKSMQGATWSPIMLPPSETNGLTALGSPLQASTTSSNWKASGDPCQDLEPDIWFTAAHRIDLCVDGSRHFGLTYDKACDINSDGHLEFVTQNRNLWTLSSSTPADTSVLWADFADTSSAVTSMRYRPVMTAEPLLSLISSLSNVPPGASVYVNLSGFRDMDSDGDRDAVFHFSWDGADGVWTYTFAWIENTGYPVASPPNPYDLDGDGGVNAGDISLLLLNFAD